MGLHDLLSLLAFAGISNEPSGSGSMINVVVRHGFLLIFRAAISVLAMIIDCAGQWRFRIDFFL